MQDGACEGLQSVKDTVCNYVFVMRNILFLGVVAAGGIIVTWRGFG